MTFNVGHVAGGSHAGWKIQKPAPKPWACACVGYGGSQAPTEGRRQQPAYMSRCSDCGATRDVLRENPYLDEAEYRNMVTRGKRP